MARVRHKRHARVRDDQDEAGAGDADKLLSSLFLIVIKIGHDLATNLRAQRCGERAGPARVLSGDDICTLKCFHETRRGITNIA